VLQRVDVALLAEVAVVLVVEHAFIDGVEEAADFELDAVR